MQYDPIKDRFGALVAGRPWAMRLFFSILQVVFLRAWYVRRALRSAAVRSGGRLRMLDAGTGFGQFSWWMARRYPGVRIHAVDIKNDYLDWARVLFERYGLDARTTFGVDDLTRLKAVGPYDLILSVDVMEHIEEDETVFSHFHRVLRSGGTVIINTPSDQGGSDVGADGDASFIGEHVRDGYGRDELREKLERAGFAVERIDYTYGPWGSMAWKLLIKYPMLLLSKTFAAVILLPFYYLPALPLATLFNFLDVSTPNHTGTGLIAVARRP